METWELIKRDREVLLAVARTRAARAAYRSLREATRDLDPNQLGDIHHDLEEFRGQGQRALEELGERVPETMLGLHGLLVLAREVLQEASEQYPPELGLVGRVLTLSDAFARNQLKERAQPQAQPSGEGGD